MITKLLTANYEVIQLTKELQTVYNNSSLDVCFRGNQVEVGVEATEENIGKLNTAIANHDYSTGRIEKRKRECRAKRDKLLTDTDYVIQRHLEQTDSEGSKTLTDQQYQSWLVYRQALRDLPATIITDADPEYPVKP